MSAVPSNVPDAPAHTGILLLRCCCLIGSWNYFAFARNNPGIRIRITEGGLDYINAVAEKSLNRLIKTMEIPPLRLNFTLWLGRGDFTLWNLHLTLLTAPNYSYELVPGHGIKWMALNGSLDLTGQWSVRYSILLTARASGTLNVSARNIGWSVFFSVQRGLNSRPKIKLFTCDVEMESFDMLFGDGIIPHAMNYFKGTVVRAFKIVVQNQMCQHAETAVLQMLNDRITTMPVSFPINQFLSLNYGLVEDILIERLHIDCAIDGRLSSTAEPESDFPCNPLNHFGTGKQAMLNFLKYLSHNLNWVLASGIHMPALYNFTLTNLAAEVAEDMLMLFADMHVTNG
ncbi:unnamed protein product [Soboliphyme baturini]|uniref:BPI1 domain-containing protein n=1 Tax=Soboliphyme baturini TaxID=241478 RepID=A0A183ITC6_9BILA|nr:unnamed protein product [Soboliphyme baturini]